MMGQDGDLQPQLKQIRLENAQLRDARTEIDAEIDAARDELSAWRRSELMPGRLRGALYGMLLGDALAAPTHFYPDRESIEHDIGVLDGFARGFRQPCAHHPCPVLESSRYDGAIDILHSARRFYNKPQRLDGKYSHPHRGLAAGENTLHGQLIQLLLQAMLQAEDFIPHFLSTLLDFLVAEGPDGEPAKHNDIYTYPWLRSYFERLSAVGASALVGPRRSAAAAIARQKRRQCGQVVAQSEILTDGSACTGVPGSLLPLLIPIVLNGIARSGGDGCKQSGPSEGRTKHGFAQTVHACVELAVALTDSEVVVAVRDTVSMWCETLWDVLWPLVKATHPPATVFARPAPAGRQCSTKSQHAPDPDPCEELLLQLRGAGKSLINEDGRVNATSSMWVSNVEASCILGGDSITRSTVLAGVLGAAVGFDGLPTCLVSSLRDAEKQNALIHAFVSAVTEGDGLQFQAAAGVIHQNLPVPAAAASIFVFKPHAEAEDDVVEHEGNHNAGGAMPLSDDTRYSTSPLFGSGDNAPAKANGDVLIVDDHDSLVVETAEINMHRGVAARGPVGLGTWTDTRHLLPDSQPSARTGSVDTAAAYGEEANELLSCSSVGTSSIDWYQSAVGSPGSIADSFTSSSSRPARSSSRASMSDSVSWSSDSFGSAIEFGPVDATPS